jgi:general secretion pathway protein N
MLKIRLCRQPLLLFVFILGYVAFLTASLPAAQVLSRVPLPAGLQLYNISGSLWQGRIGELHWQKYRLQNLRWEVLFSRLWLALPTLQLSLQDPDTAIASGRIGWRGKWYFDEWQIKTSAATLQNWVALPTPISAAGDIKLQLSQLVLSQTGCQSLAATFDWHQALLKTPLGDLSLDNPTATLSCKDNKLDAVVQQDSSVLHTQASLQLSMQQQYKLKAALQPGAELSKELRASLDWLGTPDSKGVIRVNENGHF